MMMPAIAPPLSPDEEDATAPPAWTGTVAETSPVALLAAAGFAWVALCRELGLLATAACALLIEDTLSAPADGGIVTTLVTVAARRVAVAEEESQAGLSNPIVAM